MALWYRPLVLEQVICEFSHSLMFMGALNLGMAVGIPRTEPQVSLTTRLAAGLGWINKILEPLWWFCCYGLLVCLVLVHTLWCSTKDCLLFSFVYLSHGGKVHLSLGSDNQVKVVYCSPDSHDATETFLNIAKNYHANTEMTNFFFVRFLGAPKNSS